MKKTKILITAIICLILVSITAISASALSWTGTSSGGGGNASAATTTGFAIWNDTEDTVVIGYRLSVVSSTGSTQKFVIDIFRNTTNMSSDYKFSTKYNKSQLISLQNSSFSTSSTVKYCYSESEFSISLPDPSAMSTWATRETNLDPILKELGYTNGVDDLNYGDKIIVEPIFRVKLSSVYHSLTLTEIALYGKYLFGATSNGGSSWDSGTWGFIASYTNMYFPNWLYTTDGMGLWTNASKLSSQATFYTLINSGYGVGIAYTETTQNTGSIVYNANGGTLSSSTYSLTGYSHIQNASGDKFFHTITYGTTANPRNATTFGLTKTGYTFLGWNTSADGSGTFFDQDTDYAATKYLSSLATTNGGYVILYAQWEANTGSIVYNANGGSLSSSTYSLTGYSHVQNSSGDKFFHTLTYGVTANPRNATTFGLTKTGYTFLGWNTSADGSGTFFDQSTDYAATKYVSSLSSSSGGYVILYAQWEVNTSYIWYNPNGGTLDSERFDLYSGTIRRIEDLTRYFDKITYNTACDPVNASTFGLTKTGYTFVGWNSKADGTGTFFDQNTSYYPTEYKSTIATTTGGYVTLYAQWEVNTVSVWYNSNGGSITSETYELNSSNNIRKISWASTTTYTFTYNEIYNPVNASTFGLSKDGYTFIEWNTKADGTGISINQSTDYYATYYYPNLATTTGGTVTLYAQWEANEPNTAYIWYNPNGATPNYTTYDLYSGTIRRVSDLTRYFHKITNGTTDDPYNATTFGLTKAGYTFVGWNTEADGSGTFFDQNTQYSATEYKPTIATTSGGYVTLYAQWEVNTVSVWYNSNGGSITSETYELNSSNNIRKIAWASTTTYTFKYNEVYNPVNASTFGLSKAGYTFIEWNTKADGTGISINQSTDYYATYYYPNLATTTGGTVTLYAQWQANTGSIVYNANGGSLSSSTYSLTSSSHIQNSNDDKFFHIITYGTTANPRNATTFGMSQTGYTFLGWNTAADGSGTFFDQDTDYSAIKYLSSLSTTSGGYVILYAQWQANTGSIVYNANGGSLSSSTYSLTSSSHIQNSSDDKFFHIITYGTTANPRNATTFGLTKSGFSFIGWNTAADGSGTFFDENTEYNSTAYYSSLATTTGGYVILYAQWESTSDIYPEYIAPNSDYRQGTEIIVSFNIINSSNYDFTPSNYIETSFTATSTDTNGVITQIYNSVDDVIVPSNEQNLVYYKLTVPDNAKTLTFTMTAQTDSSINEVNYENNNITIVKDVATVINSQTADTIFTSTPSNFYLPSISASVPTLGMVVENNASWSVWEWVNNDFKLETYGIKFEPIIVLYGASLNSSSMKSGYGFGFFSTSDITPDSNYNQPSADSYTIAQNGAVFFPEFSYSSSIGMYRSLTFIEQNSVFVFAENPYSINSQGSQNFSQLHYVPLYFPNGEYAVKSLIYDVWTPAGMIASTTTSTITIDGNVYDDWYAH